MFLSFLYSFFLYPIELIIELFFVLFNKLFSNCGASIILIAFFFTAFSIPLYRQIINRNLLISNADKKELDKNKLFLQILRYLIQVLLFFAVLHFFNSLYILQESTFLFIWNLSDSDSLIKIGSFSINILPLLLFVFTVFGVAFLHKTNSLTDKILGIIMSIIQLAFLYNASAALNLFWLVNTVLYQLLKSFSLLNTNEKEITCGKSNASNYFFSAGLITVLLGLLIPLSVLVGSVSEFINNTGHTLYFVFHSFCVASGTFILWGGIIYFLSKDNTKNILNTLVLCLFGVFFVNYLFFGNDFGTITVDLVYENEFSYSFYTILINIVVNIAVVVLLCILKKKRNDLLKVVVIVLLIGLILLSGFYIYCVIDEINNYNTSTRESTMDEPSIPLSTDGKNVVVLVLDRAISGYIPFIMDEDPNLLEQFDGFVYYPNCLSYGLLTNYAIPAVYGGYEYTPSAINERDDELLKDKHNEALKLMPALFYENGYEVSVSDSPYVNYRESGDVSIYKRYKGMNAFSTFRYFTSDLEEKMDVKSEEYRERNFYMYGVFRSSPALLQDFIYDNESYLSSSPKIGRSSFNAYYTAIDNLDTMTNVEDNDNNTFFLMYSMITHEPTYLDENYEPTLYVPNTDPYNGTTSKECNGVELLLETENQIIHYQANMATMKLLGDWFDYLRENNLYDNTRIIIVSDHGRSLGQFTYMSFSEETNSIDLQAFNPLLLVKDFNSTGFVTSDELMTNADVPTLATKDIIDNPINPFTGNLITNSDKYSGELLVTAGDIWEVSINNGTTFDNGGEPWYVFKGADIFDEDSWSVVLDK